MSFYLPTIQAIWWVTVRRVAHPTWLKQLDVFGWTESKPAAEKK